MNHKRDKSLYEKIIDYPYPYPTFKKKMSMTNRASQFAPFAALTGYDSAILETSRLTEKPLDLSQEEMDVLNARFNDLQNHVDKSPTIGITYFIKDDKKEGGTYVTKISEVNKIDVYKRILVLADKTEIPFDSIYELFGDLFETVP